MEVISILAAIVLIIGCGMFVAAEFSLITVNKNTVKAHADAGDRRAQGVLTSVKTLSTQLSGAQLGITVTNLGIGFLAEPAIAQLTYPTLVTWGLSSGQARSVSIAIALILATGATMIFGELVPKTLPSPNPGKQYAPSPDSNAASSAQPHHSSSSSTAPPTKSLEH